jgi:hypothetical protein
VLAYPGPNYRSLYVNHIKMAYFKRPHTSLGTRGSVVVKALRYKPKVAGSRPHEVNF